MEKKPVLKESVLYDLWRSGELDKLLTTFDGEKVTVLEHGKHDSGMAGPDFKDAKIKIGKFLYSGDIEIDYNHNDWINHGHYLDAKYNSVILHLVVVNKKGAKYVFNRAGRKINTVCLSDFMPESRLVEMIPDTIPEDGEHKNLKCADLSTALEEGEKTEYLNALGLRRFEAKCSRIFERVKELAYLHELNIKEPVVNYELPPSYYKHEFDYKDFQSVKIWQQVFYESVFEALGYIKNKNIMIKLARACPVDFLETTFDGKDSLEVITSVLFKISGLVPEIGKIRDEEGRVYVRRTEEIWNEVKERYDGAFFCKSDWHFFRSRPQNFPTVRLAGGAVLADGIISHNLIERLIKMFGRINNETILIKAIKSMLIIKAEGFWRSHYTFEEQGKEKLKYLIGGSRADEIIINVLLPFMSVFGEIYGNQILSKRALSIYVNYVQNENNSILNFVSKSLGLKENSGRSLLSQGIIELYVNQCSKDKCLECEIGKKVFN